MIDQIIVRDETVDDERAITDVTIAAFKDMQVSNQTEHFIIKALRAAGALSVSLVAEYESQVIAHIAFSPVAISDGTGGWYGLGPVSVLPKYQSRGVGALLIGRGLDRLKAAGAAGCCLVGHPRYYGRFGFENTDQLICEGVPAEVFFALSFNGQMPSGTVSFHEAFRAES